MVCCFEAQKSLEPRRQICTLKAQQQTGRQRRVFDREWREPGTLGFEERALSEALLPPPAPTLNRLPGNLDLRDQALRPKVGQPLSHSASQDDRKAEVHTLLEKAHGRRGMTLAADEQSKLSRYVKYSLAHFAGTPAG
jgi:hypothetical protein